MEYSEIVYDEDDVVVVFVMYTNIFSVNTVERVCASFFMFQIFPIIKYHGIRYWILVDVIFV